jgi:hypothetical protein
MEDGIEIEARIIRIFGNINRINEYPGIVLGAN